MDTKIVSKWSGSEFTYDLVKKQIIARWGSDEGEQYDPKSNCHTFRNWKSLGYSVKKGEKAIQSFVVVEQKDEKGNVIKSFPKRINLFYQLQVEKTEDR